MLLAVSAALAASPSPEVAAALSGSWRLAEPRPTVQTRVDAAIETALAPFNVVVRGVARSPLRETATFCDGYAIRATATTFSVACDARGEVTVPFDGPAVAGTSPDGRAYTVSGRFENGTVILTFAAEAGFQRVRYTSGGPGSFLVTKTVHSDRLGADVTWDMRYGRP